MEGLGAVTHFKSSSGSRLQVLVYHVPFFVTEFVCVTNTSVKTQLDPKLKHMLLRADSLSYGFRLLYLLCTVSDGLSCVSPLFF